MPCRSTATASLWISLLCSSSRRGRRGVCCKKAPAGGVFGNIGVDQEDAAVLGGGIALGDVGLASAQGLHLRAGELDPGLIGVLDAILKPGLAVLGNALAAVVLVGGHDGTSR